ncbi:hypothetical protein BKA69DRAFT_1048465 [Paraphysoderma sedebokerense]|nr:hypothetical protein BKA69DRAFT_1048465 [Paraphysoderma sedebokerense]
MARHLDSDVGQRLETPNTSIKNVLVTGAAGFIGSFLVRKLVHLYPEVMIHGIDKLDYCASLKSLEGLGERPNFEFIKGDVTSADFMFYLIREKKIDTIIHLAAQTHVDNSFGDSFEFTKNNVMGTHVLLEAAKIHKIRRFIHVSTDEVYGEISRNSPNAQEESILEPSNPYSATKAAAECLVKAYHKSFGLPVIITRSNNVFGPYQYPEKIIPKFICLLLAGKKCYIHGNGSNSRKYLYVSDVCDALDIILHQGEIGQVYNIGTDYEITNLQLAKYLIGHFTSLPDTSAHSSTSYAYPHSPSRSPYRNSGPPSPSRPSHLPDSPSSPSSPTVPTLPDFYREYLEFVPDRAFNDKRYAIDSTKLNSLGWFPKVSFKEGLYRTIQWYKENADIWWDDISSALVPHPFKKMPIPTNT